MLTDEREAALEAAVDEFNQSFVPTRTEEAEDHVTLEDLETLSDEGGPGGPDGDAADYDEAQQKVVEGPGPIS
jgi:hypothetical protein